MSEGTRWDSWLLPLSVTEHFSIFPRRLFVNGRGRHLSSGWSRLTSRWLYIEISRVLKTDEKKICNSWENAAPFWEISFGFLFRFSPRRASSVAKIYVISSTPITFHRSESVVRKVEDFLSSRPWEEAKCAHFSRSMNRQVVSKRRSRRGKLNVSLHSQVKTAQSFIQ